MPFDPQRISPVWSLRRQKLGLEILAKLAYRLTRCCVDAVVRRRQRP